MRHRHSDPDTPPLDINLTPLIDLVFILLIFFLVTSSSQQNNALEIQRPQAQTAQLQTQEQQAFIAIAANGNLQLDQKPIALSALRTALAHLQHNAPNLQLVLIADQQTPTGLLVQVMDQARLAGIHQLALAADPHE